MGVILDSVDFKEGSKVLDIGCSTGSLLIELSQIIGNKCEFIGIDASEKRIEKARKASEKLGIKFEVGKIENLEYEDNYFDIVISTFLYHRLNIELKKEGTEELKRVLKPNGKLFLIDVGKPTNPFSYFMALILRWFQEFDTNIHGEVIDVLKEAGFKIEFVKNTTRLVGTVNIILIENTK